MNPALPDGLKLTHRLGGGAGNAVWAAEREGEPLVVKRLPRGLDEAGRAELAALSALDLPGVVRLVDLIEADDGEALLIMQRAPGRPFPAGAHTWEALAPLLRATLEVLREVHAAGIVHRDLKPEHVLVDEHGAVTLLDFGLACGEGARLERGDEGLAGTLRYAAPEQLLRAAEVDARADLYSLGLMAREALTGEVLHDAAHEAELIRRRLSEPPPPLPEAHGPDAALLLEGLLARKPRRRLASADAALALLRRDTLSDFNQATAHWRGPLDADTLQRLFAGPERVLHIPSDAAGLLLRWHGGAPEATAETLRAWLGTGRARWQGGALHLTREALLRLDLDEQRQPLAAALREQRWPEAVDRAVAMGREAWTRGRVDEALGLIDPAMLAAARARDAAAGRRVAELACLLGLSANARRANLQVAHQLHRSPWRSPDLEALLGVDALARRGELARARELLESVGRIEDEALGRWRPALAIRIAQRQADPAAMDRALAFAEAWAGERGTPTARGDVLNWRGLAAYRCGDMAAACALHGEALALKGHGTGRLSARLNQISAMLELPGRAEEAAEAARALRDEARDLRHPVFEAHAEWALRLLAFRGGEARRPDRALVEAMRHLGRTALHGQLFQNEAAVAWRAGDLDAARGLADEAWLAWRHDGRRALPALAEALVLSCARPVPLDCARALGEQARQALDAGPEALPSVWLQALGALAWASPALREEQAALRAALRARVPPAMATGRREIMSADEAAEGRSHSGDPGPWGG